MAPRPSSPTSLLWAHQLKKEHTYLLERVKCVEDLIKRLETTSKNIEASEQVIKKNVADNEKRLTTISKSMDELRIWIEKLDAETHSKISDTDTRLAALGKTIGVLRTDFREMSNAVEKIDTEAENLTMRLENLETKEQKDTKLEEKIGRKDNPTDARVLSRRLDVVETGRGEDGIRMRALLGRMEVIEASNREAIEQLQQSINRETLRTTEDRRTPPMRANSELTTDGEENTQNSFGKVLVPESPQMSPPQMKRPEFAPLIRSPTLRSSSRENYKNTTSHTIGNPIRSSSQDLISSPTPGSRNPVTCQTAEQSEVENIQSRNIIEQNPDVPAIVTESASRMIQTCVEPEPTAKASTSTQSQTMRQTRAAAKKTKLLDSLNLRISTRKMNLITRVKNQARKEKLIRPLKSAPRTRSQGRVSGINPDTALQARDSNPQASTGSKRVAEQKDRLEGEKRPLKKRKRRQIPQENELPELPG